MSHRQITPRSRTRNKTKLSKIMGRGGGATFSVLFFLNCRLMLGSGEISQIVYFLSVCCTNDYSLLSVNILFVNYLIAFEHSIDLLSVDINQRICYCNLGE